MYLLLTLFALAIVLLSILVAPVSAHIAKIAGGLDIPEARKLHRFPTPRLGGLGIAVLFFSCVFTLSITGFLLLPKEVVVFLVSLALITLMGIVDDQKNIPALLKLIFELLLASLVFIGGIRVSPLFGSLLAEFSQLLISPIIILTNTDWPKLTHAIAVSLDYLLTLAWFIFISNAINLVDGLDGLATSTGLTIATVLSLSILLILPWAESAFIVILLSLFILILLGFFHWNRPPAVIFLGDSGSLYIGWFLACISLFSASKMTSILTDSWLLIPGLLLLFGYPLTDTILSITRRLSHCFTTNNTNYIKYILTPDRLHLHHRLNPDGRHTRHALFRLTRLNFAYGILALISFSLSGHPILASAIPEGWGWLRLLPLAVGLILQTFLLFWQNAQDTSTPSYPQTPNFPLTP